MFIKRLRLKRVKSNISSLIICLLISPIFATVCTKDNSGSNTPPDSLGNHALITTDGGTVTDSNGVSVSIPPGALSESVNISVISYSDNSSSPSGWCPVPGFAGAVEFGPDGLTFLTPVKITIPVSNPKTPGEKFPLILWESGSDTIVQTDFMATVNPDGMSFSAEVTHFCGYGGIDVNYLIEGGDPETFLDLYIEWYQNSKKKIRAIEDRIKLGDKRAKNNECWEVVGLDFILDWEINGQRDGEMKRVGRSTDNSDAPLIMIAVDWDISDGNSMTVFIQLTIVAYYDCTAPEITVKANPSTLLEGDTSEVSANLLCEGTPMVDKEVQFEVSSGPGKVNPTTATTSSGGDAQVTFTASDENAVVKATNEACTDDTPKTIKSEQEIKIAPTEFTLDISYVQTMDIPDNWFDTFSYIGSVPFEVTTTNPDGSGNLDGNKTFEVSGSGHDYDECTWTTEGNVSFVIIGTLVFPQDSEPMLELTLTPNFNASMTTVCPDSVITQQYLAGGEPFDYNIPMVDGHTDDNTINEGPITGHITYVLHILN